LHSTKNLRGPLKIRFVRQANLFNSGLPQTKDVLASAKAAFGFVAGIQKSSNFLLKAIIRATLKNYP